MPDSTIIKIPGYKYNEYQLVLRPHEGLCEQVLQIIQEFSEKYRTPLRQYPKPAILLAHFVHFEMVEERLVSRLAAVAAGYPPFTVELRDFGSLPSHTIFINTGSKERVRLLATALKSAQRLMTLDKDNKPHFIQDPHLIIARKLLPWQYEKGWLEYSHRHFTGLFTASSLLLLKRPLEQRNYRLVRQIELRNLSVNKTQGDLFS